MIKMEINYMDMDAKVIENMVKIIILVCIPMNMYTIMMILGPVEN